MKISLKSTLKILTALFLFTVTTLNLNAQTMKFERIYDETLAQASYIIANNNNEAIVIDPKRDIDTYLTYAKEHGVKIKYVAETHIHADYLSGARELALATQSTLLLSDEGGEDWQYEFAHTGLKNNQIISLGEIQLQVMHTPGHTPESITFLVKDLNNPNDAIKAITGDFIFVGDVGRPDLLEKAAGQAGSQYTGAHQLFNSLNQFVKLPKNTEIWPGHGAGSFCGKSLSTIPQSTLEQEILTSPAFKFLNDKELFTNFILEGQPVPPKYFAVMKQWNKEMRPLKIQISKYPELSLAEFQEAINNNVLIIDTRKKEDVAKGFIPGSLHIEGGKSFSTFVGSIVDYDKQIILIARPDNIEDLTRKLMRIGFDNIYGYLPKINGLTNLKSASVISIDTFKKHLKDKKLQIIDVRTATEYENGHIKGVKNIPLNTLEANTSVLKKDQPIVIHCQSGARAAMAYSILERLGFEAILNYSGGINEWTATKNKLEK